MIAVFKFGYNFLATHRRVRMLLLASVSLGLLALLGVMAYRNKVIDNLQALEPAAVALAAALYTATVVLNAWRWQVLLRHVGVRESVAPLTGFYLIGQFFSLFLPTSAGGDAVRMYEVGRRSGRVAEAVVATLQERLLVLGGALLIGLGVTLHYLPLLPPEFRIWAILAQVGSAVGIALLLYPALLFAAARWLWRSRGQRLAGHPVVARVAGVLRPLAEMSPLTPFRFVLALGMAGASVLLSIGVFWVIAQSLNIRITFLELCLVVPLVWIVRMLPISLNGIGVGEGASVFLLGLFAVPEGPALTMAVTMLGLHTAFSLAGGLILAGQVACGTWAGGRHPAEAVPAANEPSPVDESEETPQPEPADAQPGVVFAAEARP